MAPRRKHNLRLTADRLNFLGELAHRNHTSDAAVLVAAIEARLERARTGELPPGHGPKIHSQFYVPDGVWESVRALAGNRHTDVTEEFEAAIDDLIASDGSGKPAKRPSLRAPRTAKPPATVKFQAPDGTPAPLGLPADEDCPHPAAVRQKKGTYCPRCGTGGLS